MDSNSSLENDYGVINQRSTTCVQHILSLCCIFSAGPTPEEAVDWGYSIESLLDSKYGAILFQHYLRTEYCDESIAFYKAVVKFRKSSPSKLLSKSRIIIDKFIRPHAPREIHMNYTVKANVVRAVEQRDVTNNTFDEVLKGWLTYLEEGPYIRFLTSDLYMARVYPEYYE